MTRHGRLSRWMALGLLLLAGCQSERKGTRSPVLVTVQPASEYTAQTPNRYSAGIVPASQVTLAFRVGGYVEEILQVAGHPAQEGDLVQKGAIMARLRGTEYQARVRQAEAQMNEAHRAAEGARAQLSEAEAAQRKAQADFGRAEALFQARALTRPDFDAARAQLDMTSARVRAAQAQIESVQAREQGAEAVRAEAAQALADTRLPAPLSGVVIRREVETGSLATPGSPAFVLADTATVKAVLGIPDVDLPMVRAGQSLTLTADALPDRPLTGKISAISSAADPQTRLFSVEVTLPNPGRLIHPGMIVSVSLTQPGPPRQLVVVPLPAVIRSPTDPNRYSVAVVEGESGGMAVARLRSVRLGDVFGNQISIREGVRAGERVVVSGASYITDGETVRVAR